MGRLALRGSSSYARGRISGLGPPPPPDLLSWSLAGAAGPCLAGPLQVQRPECGDTAVRDLAKEYGAVRGIPLPPHAAAVDDVLSTGADMF